VSQNHCDGFLVWTSKTSSLRFFGCATKLTGECCDVGHASRSKANRVRVFQSSLKIVGGEIKGGGRDINEEVASSEN
jgi:hypothetical protein